MTNYEIKITGEGTQNQIAIALLELGRSLQVKGVYEPTESIEGTYEDSILLTEIKES